MKIVMLGKTRVGKSSVGNTTFGEERFKIDHTFNSEKSECRAETKSVNGRNITVIDTPGFFDTDRPEEELISEIVKCITECSPGLHAFLIVLKVEKFTEQDQDVIMKINKYFSEEAFKYATVLFTHGDQLEEGQTIEDFVRDNELVSDLVKKCGGRCHVIDNKYWKNNQQDEYRSNQFQVKELLNTIEKMITNRKANKGSCYTNEMLQAVEAGIKQEQEHIRQSSGNMSEEEITEKAKDKVFERFLIDLASITTGALLGALFGVVLMGGEVYKLLKKVLPEPGQCERVLSEIAAAAAATAGGTAGIAVGALVGAATIGGAIKGAFRGYDAAEGADTACEAAKRAAKAVMDDVRSVFEAHDKTDKYKS